MATALRGGRFLAAIALAVVFIMPATLMAQTPTLRVTLTGQSVIRTDMRAATPAEVPIIKSLLGGDAVFTILESTVIDQSKGRSPKDGRFAAPPEAIDSLKEFGFNLLALSSNHVLDFKVPGIQDTLEAVNRAGLAHAGIGENLEEASAPAYLKTPKGTVALIAFASGGIPAGLSATATQPGVNELHVDAENKPNDADVQRIIQSVHDARSHSDLVIVYDHNHVFDKPYNTMVQEELPERLTPPIWIKDWAHKLADAGADIVAMDGGLIYLQGVEIYHGHPIFYDLGSFIQQLPPPVILHDEPISWESAVAYVDYQGRNLRSIQFRPIAMNKVGEGEPDMHDEHTNNLYLQTRGLPTPATKDQAHYILERLADLSRPLGTTIVQKGDMAEVKLEGGK